MFKYLVDKNNIIKSLSGIRKIYNKFKYKIEKENFIREFVEDESISHDILLDFSKMMHSNTGSNFGTQSETIDFGDGNTVYYNNLVTGDGIVNLLMEHQFNGNSDMSIKINTQSSFNERFITITDNIKGIRMSYVLHEEYTDDLREYVKLMKVYMLYMFEYILSGGLEDE